MTTFVGTRCFYALDTPNHAGFWSEQNKKLSELPLSEFTSFGVSFEPSHKAIPT